MFFFYKNDVYGKTDIYFFILKNIYKIYIFLKRRSNNNAGPNNNTVFRDGNFDMLRILIKFTPGFHITHKNY